MVQLESVLMNSISGVVSLCSADREYFKSFFSKFVSNTADCFIRHNFM